MNDFVTSKDETLQAARLLQLGRTPRRRAVDLLIEHLASQQDPERLETLLAAGPAVAVGSVRGELVDGGADLVTLIQLKERCKQTSDFEGVSGRLARLAGYFTSIAAALVHYDVLITDHSFEDLQPILLDLAGVTTSPWSELYSRATLARPG